MSLTSLATSLKQAFNRSNPNSLPSMLKAYAFGDFLRSMPTQLRAVAPTTDPYGPAANVALFLPEDAKAESIVSAYARAGAGPVGPLTVDAAYSATPAAGHVCIDPAGNLLFHAADAWTSVDARYIPKEADVVEVTLPVVTGVLTIPAVFVACDLLEAQRADGSSTKLQVNPPAATNVAVGTASLNLAKTTVLFDVADGVTSARVKLAVKCAVDRNGQLEAASTFI